MHKTRATRIKSPPLYTTKIKMKSTWKLNLRNLLSLFALGGCLLFGEAEARRGGFLSTTGSFQLSSGGGGRGDGGSTAGAQGGRG